jgi:hypothetical protein
MDHAGVAGEHAGHRGPIVIVPVIDNIDVEKKFALISPPEKHLIGLNKSAFKRWCLILQPLRILI